MPMVMTQSQLRFFASGENGQNGKSTESKENGKSVEDQIADHIKEDKDGFLDFTNKSQKSVQERHEDARKILERVKVREDIDTYDEGEKDPHFYQDEDMPLDQREKKQTQMVFETFREQSQWGEFYRVAGFALTLIGGFWLVIPFYNVICQQFGFTMYEDHIDYKFKDDEVNVFRKFRVSFLSHIQDELPWEFEALTNNLVVNSGETALAFYRVYNRTDRPIAGIAIYQIFPDEAALYFNKIQCFCFENQLLYPNESIDLPLLFYIDPAIHHDVTLKDVKEILLTYHFYPSADQTIAEVLADEIEKHQKEEKILEAKKMALIKKGVEGIDDTKNRGVVAPGYNPKDKPEMYVRKILENQKRMKYTIDQYVQEHELDPEKVEIKPLSEESKKKMVETKEIEDRLMSAMSEADQARLKKAESLYAVQK